MTSNILKIFKRRKRAGELSDKCKLAAELSEQGKYLEAIVMCAEELESGKRSWGTHYVSATATYLLHKKQGTVTMDVVNYVIKEYEESIKLNPNYSHAHLNLGVLYKHKALLLVPRLREEFGEKTNEKIKNISHALYTQKSIEFLFRASKRHIQKSIELGLYDGWWEKQAKREMEDTEKNEKAYYNIMKYLVNVL